MRIVVVLAGPVELTDERRTELRRLANSPDVAATVTTRARIMLWRNEGRSKRDIAALAPVADIVGLYLDPPGTAVVLSLDEKTQIQGLGRTQPLLPIDFHASEKRTHDYVHHGTKRPGLRDTRSDW